MGENILKENRQKKSTQITFEEYKKKEKPIEKCQFCNKLSHKQEECRKKSGVCWEFGGKNHIARHCLQRL